MSMISETITNEVSTNKITANKVLRGIALFFHVVAVISYFIPTLVIRSSMDAVWLVAGVVHTGLFCLIFYRKSRKRRILSVATLIIIIMWCGIWIFITLPALQWNVAFDMLYIYIISSLFAAIFALANPKKL